MTNASDDEDVARLLLDWIVSKEGQKAIHPAYPAVPVRTNVPMPVSDVALDLVDSTRSMPRGSNANREPNIERFRNAFGP